MTIGELEKATGLKRSTIRVYENMGLLRSEESARGNGYRVFTLAHVERIGAIRMAQGLGFSLKETAAMMDAWENGRMSRAEKRKTLDARLTAVEEKRRQLNAVVRWLRALIAWVDSGETGEKPRLR
jgi:MerR family transcriptional regulator, copper efflux regulator